MKLRTGFVSNSSSSSFCILGVSVDAETIDKVEGAFDVLKNTRIRTQYSISHDDGKYVGIDVTSMKDDETPAQLKKELVETLRKVGIEVAIESVEFIEDGGYNG